MTIVERGRQVLPPSRLIALKANGQPTMKHVCVERVSLANAQADNSAEKSAITRNTPKFILARKADC